MAANVGLTEERVLTCMVSALIEGATLRDCAKACRSSHQSINYALSAARKPDAPQYMRDQAERLDRAERRKRESIDDALAELTKATS